MPGIHVKTVLVAVVTALAAADRSGAAREATLLPQDSNFRDSPDGRRVPYNEAQPSFVDVGAGGALTQRQPRAVESDGAGEGRILQHLAAAAMRRGRPQMRAAAVRAHAASSLAQTAAKSRGVGRLGSAGAQELGTEVGVESAQATQTRSGSRFYGLVFGPARMILQLCAACVCFAVLFKMMGKIDCASKKMDARRWCRCCGRNLLAAGWDEFEGFDITVKVHSVADISNKNMIGGENEYRVSVRFKWSKYETLWTRDMSWESVKTMEVPQGASECVIALYQKGRFRDTVIGRLEFETKRDMIDRPDFWGKKHKLKLEKSGKELGKLLITFWKSGGAEGEDGAGGGQGMAEVPVEGVDADSPLAHEIRLAIEQLQKTPGFVVPTGKWEGHQKLHMLSVILEGELRRVNSKGKETGKVYVKMLRCNISHLKGERHDRDEEYKRQLKKAKEKGLAHGQVDEKWYWVTYESKKAFKDKEKCHFPETFFPMTAISSVHSSPERTDQFLVKYNDAERGGKESVIYRRETGKGRDVWIEGIDMAFQETRKLIKESKAKPQEESQALSRMHAMHQQFVAQNGIPQTMEQWKVWSEWFKENNYSDDLIKKLYQDLAKKQAANEPKKKAKTRK